MKAILIIDGLKDCTDCLLVEWTDSHTIRCRKLMQSKKPDKKRFDDCPLKPMPRKINLVDAFKMEDFARGWNACLDEIMGEAE